MMSILERQLDARQIAAMHYGWHSLCFEHRACSCRHPERIAATIRYLKPIIGASPDCSPVFQLNEEGMHHACFHVREDFVLACARHKDRNQPYVRTSASF
jgi:hypothetical protein